MTSKLLCVDIALDICRIVSSRRLQAVGGADSVVFPAFLDNGEEFYCARVVESGIFRPSRQNRRGRKTACKSKDRQA